MNLFIDWIEKFFQKGKQCPPKSGLFKFKRGNKNVKKNIHGSSCRSFDECL